MDEAAFGGSVRAPRWISSISTGCWALDTRRDKTLRNIAGYRQLLLVLEKLGPASQNAFRHGLSKCISSAEFVRELETLALQIAGDCRGTSERYLYG
jgi:hypothetical protein